MSQEFNVNAEQKPVLPSTNTRQILYNTPCYYFFNARGGCTRPDCHFMHDECETPTYDSRVSPGKLVDAKLYVRNIPPLMKRQDIANIVEPCGYVKRIVLLPSKHLSGRMAAIIHMTSEAQADIAVKALNAHIDYTGEKLMAEKQAVIPVSTKDLTPPSPIIPPAKSPVTVMTCIPCIPPHENVWEVIADYDDDKSVDEDDEADSDEEMTSTYSAKDFCLEKCNMPYLVAHANIRTPDRGVWNDELRVTAMIENIAF